MSEYLSQNCVDLVYDVYDGTDDDTFAKPLPPVVIFHGLGDCKENWKYIASSIADRTVRKVYVPDIRNHGKSPKTSNMTLEANVNDFEKFLRFINEPVIVIGHSFGGITALYLSFQKYIEMITVA
ncbi:protein ABHD11-like [Centruroides sculpturatus]|uniref:protein ABHD11-like n=1 Tax=Centruroides sculpturatus TaxID=218467 RepID=UPI000C6D66C1|nr:protein ABHD11-like [Centruroides sculpturatus]